MEFLPLPFGLITDLPICEQRDCVAVVEQDSRRERERSECAKP